MSRPGFNTRRCDWRVGLWITGGRIGTSFNTRRCDWRAWSDDYHATDFEVSIPEGAIEGGHEPREAFDWSPFQYPKVRLKVGSIWLARWLKVRFNTRRCDWRYWHHTKPPLHSIVSIPEGAIEGFIGQKRKDFVYRFNTRRCDWRLFELCCEYVCAFVSIPEGAIEGEAGAWFWGTNCQFQYPKVRLKV